MGSIDQENQLSFEKDLNRFLYNNTNNLESHSPNEHKRAWGPGVDKYYKDSLNDHPRSKNKILEQEVASNAAPSEKSGVLFYARKTLKQIVDIKNSLFTQKKDPIENKASEEAADINHVANSIGDKIEGLTVEAEKEFEKTKDPLTKTIISLNDKLSHALKKETIDWNKVDLLIRQLAILLLQKMANNDNVTIQEELEMMRKDVHNIRETYNTGWELAMGLLGGGLSLISGVFGITSGAFGLYGAAANFTGKAAEDLSMRIAGLKSIGDGVGGFSQGIAQPAQRWVSNTAESKRQLRQYELERDRSHKQTVESSMQGTKSLKGSQMSQRDRAIEQAYRALLQILSPSG